MNDISKLSSALVFTMVFWIFGAGFYWIWLNDPLVMAVSGAVLLASTVSFVAFMYVSKARAMWVGDAKATPRSRVTRGKS